MKKMITYNFKEYEGYDNVMYQFGGWIGKYTVGDINIRGTRLCFSPPYVVAFDGEDTESGVESCLDSLSKGDTHFPGDCCNIRSDSLAEIIQELKNQDKETHIYYKESFEKLLKNKNLIENLKNQLKKFSRSVKSSEISFPDILINNDYDISQVWLITQKNEIIKDLEEVLEKCNEECVNWIWV